MRRYRVACSLLLGAVVALTSCRAFQTLPDHAPPDGPDITPTRIDYVDSDGFDAVLENALVNQDPVIVVRTGRPQPDWDGRLNAWIAAWNRGGHNSRRSGRRAEGEAPPPRTARGQAALGKVPLDGDSIREFRLLVGGLLDRTEDLAQSSASWWAEERARSRRVGLLKPYSLRFHKDEDDLIQLVFFHGYYASYYPRYVQLLTRAAALKMEEQQWTRSLECSCCKRHAKAKLTSRAGAD